jgi:predicted nuclease with TOPRIM domain
MSQKIDDLKAMNRDEDIPQLVAEQQEIQEQFDKATKLANQLEGVMANFTDERENLQKEIEAESEWLNEMKDKLGKCDDVSGTDDDIIRRLENCKVCSILFSLRTFACLICFRIVFISCCTEIKSQPLLKIPKIPKTKCFLFAELVSKMNDI